ncbi:MAG: ImmA/IrrE family metallo-endopeptidase [Candidatus Acidiferrum sp.]
MAKRIPVDEFAAVIKAREFVRKVNPDGIPVRVEAYVEEAKAVLRRQTDLGPDEPGWSFFSGGKHHICVNANDRPERQRFTICHELAHIFLGLKSEHQALPWWSYAKRPPGGNHL